MVRSISSRVAGTVCRFGGGRLLRRCFSSTLFIVWTAVFLGIVLSGLFIILSTLFILTYMEGNLSGERSSQMNFNKYLVMYQLFIEDQFYDHNNFISHSWFLYELKKHTRFVLKFAYLFNIKLGLLDWKTS